MSRKIFTNAFVNVAPSGYLYSIFKKADFHVTYIPNNIDVVEYEFKKRKRLHPKLLYVRAFSKLYNPLMALDVVDRLKKRYPDVVLCMVGPDRDGTLEKAKEKCQEMGLEKHARFMGKMEKKEWHALSREYDIFINTTNADNTPVSLMEAMALGLPIVTTNVGGIPFLVEDGKDALLVDVEDVEAMTDKIEFLVNNADKAFNISINARKKVENFDWEKVKVKWFELLRGEKTDDL